MEIYRSGVERRQRFLKAFLIAELSVSGTQYEAFVNDLIIDHIDAAQ